jgi:hypothetical protein
MWVAFSCIWLLILFAGRWSEQHHHQHTQLQCVMLKTLLQLLLPPLDTFYSPCTCFMLLITTGVGCAAVSR